MADADGAVLCGFELNETISKCAAVCDSGPPVSLLVGLVARLLTCMMVIGTLLWGCSEL